MMPLSGLQPCWQICRYLLIRVLMELAANRDDVGSCQPLPLS